MSDEAVTKDLRSRIADVVADQDVATCDEAAALIAALLAELDHPNVPLEHELRAHLTAAERALGARAVDTP